MTVTVVKGQSPQNAPNYGIPPGELLALGWVAWASEARDGKLTKIPKSPKSGYNAAVDDPRTWATFDEAIRARTQRELAGVGPVLTAEAGITCLDLDGCRDPETGVVEASALLVAARFHSLTEISQSGRGLHVWIKATIPGPRRRSGRVEMYDRSRWIAWTGNLLPGFPTTIAERQDELDAFYLEQFPPETPKSTTPRAPAAPPSKSDAELVNEAVARWNGRFTSLWNGDTSLHGDDHSAADLALCNYLAIVAGGDEATMDRLFRQSGLYREKWDRQDYRERTIDKALSDYNPSAHASGRPLYPNGRGGFTTDPGVDVVDQAEASEPGLGPDLTPICLALFYRNAQLEREAALRRVEVKIARNNEVKTVREAVKVAAFTYAQACDSGKIRRGEPLKIFLPGLAEALGKPLKPTGRTLPNGEPELRADGGGVGDQLERYALQTGHMDYLSPDPPPGEMRRTSIVFHGADLFEDLEALAAVESLPTMTKKGATWGGKRTCPHCGGHNVVSLCRDCGAIFDEGTPNDLPTEPTGKMPVDDVEGSYGQDAPRVEPCAETPPSTSVVCTTCAENTVGGASDASYGHLACRCEFCEAPASTTNARGGPSCYAHTHYAGPKETAPEPFGGWADAAGGS